MPIFAFYDFKLGQREDEETELFRDHAAEESIAAKHYDSPEACFGSYFKTLHHGQDRRCFHQEDAGRRG